MKNVTTNTASLAAHLEKLGLIKEKTFLEKIPAASTGAIQTDSRAIKANDIFIAYRGTKSDSHQYLSDVCKKKPSLVIVEDSGKLPKDCRIPWIKVESGRQAWSHGCALAFGLPQDKMRFLGVTGTNGKSSTVWLAKELLSSLGIPCLAVGTLGAFLDDEHIETQHTTPDPPVFFALLRKALDAGVDVCIMEVSSHAIAQKRLAPLKFDGCAFTSFSRDHLDLHSTMEEYLAAKLELFGAYSKPNARHVFSDQLKEIEKIPNTKIEDTWTYGLNAKQTAEKTKAHHYLQSQIKGASLDGIDFILTDPQGARGGFIPMLGSFALENFSAALLLCEKIAAKRIDPEFWTSFSPVPGRLEAVFADKVGDSPFVCVDYSHTPDAIERALKEISKLSKGKVWIVFGCGGDRDKGKRPLMAQAAFHGADKIIVTSDNPRTEDPAKIIEDIKAGFPDASKLVSVEPDRRKAIQSAIKLAKPSDAILIAGKGHEDYMIIGKDKVHFDDRIEAKKALELLNP